jgi:hypothetical protein
MRLQANCCYRLALELSTEPDRHAPPLHREDVTDSLMDLAEECVARAILAEQMTPDVDQVQVRFLVDWADEPLVSLLRAELSTVAGGNGVVVSRFSSGPWARHALLRTQQLRLEDRIAQDTIVYRSLFAQHVTEPIIVAERQLAALTIHDGSLTSVGIQTLEPGELDPLRPVIVSHRLVEEILNKTETHGPNETGGAVLGKFVRLPEPLNGTRTHIVTLLSAGVDDQRHMGEPGAFHISPDAMAQAMQMAKLRGFNESVMTAWHSHGWGSACGNCNENPNCPLPACTDVSLADYQVMESLFVSKTAVMPIAGRKRGADGRKPVLEIHAWNGGELRPCRWVDYVE